MPINDDWDATQPLNCEYHGDVRGPAVDFALEYANDEEAWLTDYLDAWKVATDNVITHTQAASNGKAYFDEHHAKYPHGEELKTLLECDGKDWCDHDVPGFRPM